jgi:Zinc-binding dehydrogenase
VIKTVTGKERLKFQSTSPYYGPMYFRYSHQYLYHLITGAPCNQTKVKLNAFKISNISLNQQFINCFLAGLSLKNSSGKPYDYIINCTSGVSWPVLKPNLSTSGVVMDIAPNFSNFLAFICGIFSFSKKKLKLISLSLGNDDLQFLAGLVREGKLKTVIDSKYPFDRAQEAWAKSADGHATGKVIIEM